MLQQINSELMELNTMQILAEAYSRVSAMRMKRVRQGVLSNREYLGGIKEIFDEVNKTYRKKVAALMHSRGRLTFLSHNGKTVKVLLSANTGLYGNMMRQVFEKFLTEVKSSDDEVTVVGRLGRSLFIANGEGRQFSYFDLPDHNIKTEDLVEIVDHLVEYEQIHFYYGQFESVVRQKPVRKVIDSGSQMAGEVEGEQREEYFFEPSLEEIMMVFEKQIFSSLLDQTMREAELAKYASRMLSMDRATVNIGKKLKQLNKEQLTMRKQEGGRRQLNSIAGVWSARRQRE